MDYSLMDKKFALTAFGYAILGLALGLFMGISGDHSQMVTHAHIMLVGFVISFVYALCHKLWLGAGAGMAQAQFYIHQAGAAIMFVGLFLMYGGYVAEAVAGPVLGIGSILVLAGMVMMKTMFIGSYKAASRV